VKIRKNDTVVIIAGKDKGKKGKVRRALPKDDRVLVATSGNYTSEKAHCLF